MKKFILVLIVGILLVLGFGFTNAIQCSDADYDKDGDVDFKDLFEFRQCYNNSVKSVGSDCIFWDFNNDSFVGDDDLASFNEWYPSECPGSCVYAVDAIKIGKDNYTNLDSGNGKVNVKIYTTQYPRNLYIVGVQVSVIVNGKVDKKIEYYNFTQNFAKVFTFKSPILKGAREAKIEIAPIIDVENLQKTCDACDSVVVKGTTTTTCIDTDGGIVFNVTGETIVGSSIKRDSCTGKILSEWYCVNGKRSVTSKICEIDCVDGRCIKSSEIDCEDSDGGSYPYIKGVVKTNLAENPIYFEDVCIDKYYLKEYRCMNNDANFYVTFCPNGCNNGACVSISSNITNNTAPNITIPEVEPRRKITENITCKFNNIENINKKQKCYLATNDKEIYCVALPNIGSCIISYEGYEGEKLTWKSSCGGYQYTLQDGKDEVIYFNCESGETNITQIRDRGFRNAYFQCYDGTEGKSTGKECRPAEFWRKFAKDFCKTNCRYDDIEKCRPSSLSLSGECYLEEPPTEEIPESEIEGLVCRNSCPLKGKCYPFGYRKGLRYCSDEGRFVPQLKAGQTCDNNFECESNVCIDRKCISGSLLQRILNWFRRLFGRF